MPELAPIVAVIGGGQLARMMAEPAAALGIPLRLLSEAEGTSAAQVIPDTIVGDHRDLEALRKVTDGAAVVTFDHEHVPAEHLHALAEAGIAVRPVPGGAGARPGQGGDARPAHRARGALPAARRRDRRRRGGRLRAAVRAEDHARRVRRPRGVGRPRGGDGRGGVPGGAGDRRRGPRRGARRLPARAGGPRGEIAERPGGGVPGRRVHPARRHLPRGGRTGARPGARRWPPRRSRWRSPSPRSST